jgi:hypothetical protein
MVNMPATKANAIDINGQPAAGDTVQCYSGHSSLLTSVRVLQLAERLNLKVIEKAGGTHWIAFQREDGSLLSNVSFFNPSDAYAFLLGYAAGKQ